jgi:hypothetical protein
VAVKGKRYKRRRDDSESMSDKRTLKPSCCRLGAMTHTGDNDTSSRPPNDLGGASAVYVCLANGDTTWSYDAAKLAAT